jgi:hypothetical protein
LHIENEEFNLSAKDRTTIPQVRKLAFAESIYLKRLLSVIETATYILITLQFPEPLHSGVFLYYVLNQFWSTVAALKHG